MTSTVYDEPYEDDVKTRNVESGYASGASEDDSPPEVVFSKQHLKFLNSQLQNAEPEDILRWCIMSLPGLYQTTAFGLSGLVALDMLSKIPGPVKPNVDLIFLDTLHHFDETLSLVDRVRRRYPGFTLHIYKPEGAETAAEFSAKHGDSLWTKNEELYDYVAKVEPAQRAYSELQVKAVLTGRRRSQGGKRGDLDIIEVDDAGMIKINPLANWSFKQVQEYIRANNVPYNELLDRNYKSVGDWHSTQPIAEGEDERAGRWKGRSKTECGIHNPKSKYSQFLMKQELKRQEDKRQEEQLAHSLQRVSVA